MDRPILALSNVIKRYSPELTVVDIPELTIRRGEFVSFLGPSGSGKTTTLMMIAGFQDLTAGSILLNGRSVAEVPPHQRNIGVVFQNYALFPHLSVAENVRYPLRMRRMSRAESKSKVAHALDLVGLSGMDGRYPRELSGGQQQRVALARTLVFQPDLILLDEPLGALDKNLREHMQVELRRIHRELGVTMIYVTHDQSEAMTMSDRIAVFDKGRIEQIGAPHEVYHRPATEFVAGFVGDSNLLDGVVGPGGAVSVAGLGAIGVTGGRPGARVRVMMRPEIFRLVPAGTAPRAQCTTVIIEDVINYGDNLLLLARAGDQLLRARILNTAGARLQPGSSCLLEWAPDSIHILN